MDRQTDTDIDRQTGLLTDGQTLDRLTELELGQNSLEVKELVSGQFTQAGPHSIMNIIIA